MKVKWWQALLVIVVFGALLVAIANAGAKWRRKVAAIPGRRFDAR